METLRALINRERSARGLPALQPNGLLESAAQLHAVDMAGRDHLSHTGSDGSSFIDRFARVGYTMVGGGEIIAGGQGSRLTESQVVAMWMSSPGHRAHIVSADHREFGAGESRNYWCVDFGTRGA